MEQSPEQSIGSLPSRREILKQEIRRGLRAFSTLRIQICILVLYKQQTEERRVCEIRSVKCENVIRRVHKIAS